MEFKGTKGEWKAVNLEATEYYTKRNEIHYSNDGECVAEYVGCPFDATLIAAAPELLKALDDIINQLENEHCSDFMNEFSEKGKQAINKALN